MAEKGNSKKPRNKASRQGKGEAANTGKRGSKKNPQTPLALALMGKGSVQRTKSIACAPWKGVGQV